MAEVYDVPFKDAAASGSGFAPRGMDVDSNNVVWTVLSSGQLASFDRRKCKGPLNGPKATGKHCPEGWAFYAFPGPNFKGARIRPALRARTTTSSIASTCSASARTFRSRPATNPKRVLALVDGKFMTFRVPYPMGYYGKGIDGRIDDPNGGWKGKGVWTTNATRAPFHGRRQGHAEEGRQVPGEAESVGEVVERQIEEERRWAGSSKTVRPTSFDRAKAPRYSRYRHLSAGL